MRREETNVFRVPQEKRVEVSICSTHSACESKVEKEAGLVRDELLGLGWFLCKTLSYVKTSYIISGY